MPIKVFRHRELGYYLSNTYLTGTLKKTKKQVREDMRNNYCRAISSPAKTMPVKYSEAYDKIKEFLNTYLTEGRKIEIITNSNYLYNQLGSECFIRVINSNGHQIAHSDNYFCYDTKRCIGLDYFENLKPISPAYDKFYESKLGEIFEMEDGFEINDIKNSDLIKNANETTQGENETEATVLPF